MAKKIVSYILSFLCVGCVVTSILFFIVTHTILDRSYVEEQLEKINYYEQLEKTIQEGFGNHIVQSGMDESVFDGIYSKEKIRGDMKCILDVIYNHQTCNIDTTSIYQKLDENISHYILNKNIHLTLTLKEQIESFKNTIIETYKNSVLYSMRTVDGLGKVIYKVKQIIPLLQCIIYSLPFVIIISLIIINRKSISRVMHYMSIILFASGGICFVADLYNIISLKIEDTIILNDNISIFLQVVIKDILTKLNIVGFVSILLALLMTILSVIMDKEPVFKKS